MTGSYLACSQTARATRGRRGGELENKVERDTVVSGQDYSFSSGRKGNISTVYTQQSKLVHCPANNILIKLIQA